MLPLSLATPAEATAVPSAAASDVPDPFDVARAVARASGKRVEVVEQRSASTTTFVNPTGTLTTEVSGGPIRVRDGAGWKDVDLGLEPKADGRLGPKASAAAVSFGNGGSTEGATLALSGGGELGLDWLTSLPAPTVTGGVATYRLAPTVQLRLATTGDGFSAHVVLTAPPTAAQLFHLPLRLKGVTLTADADGGFTASSSTGTAVGRIAPLRMWDAAVDAAGDPANVRPVSGTVTTSPSGKQSLDLSPALSFLTDPTTKYPVTIDPNVSDVARFGDTYVYTGNTTDQQGDYKLEVGSIDSGAHVYRSYANWDMTGFGGKKILESTLTLQQYYAYSCVTRAMEVHPLTSDFNNKVWATQPTANMSSTYAVSKVFNHGLEGGGCADAPESLDVTKIVQAWVDGTIPTYGFMLSAPMASESDNLYDKRFCSMNPNSSVPYCSTASTRPALSITYAAAPEAPAAVQAMPGDAGATVHWDAPSTNGAAVTGYKIARSPGGTTTNTLSVGPDERAVTVAGLTNGTAYTFTVTATSATGSSSGATSNAVTPSAGASAQVGPDITDTAVQPAAMALPAQGVGAMADVPSPAVPADPGTGRGPVLGLEDWQSYASTDLGSASDASVNVANGNLVVQGLDSTSVQGHGRLGYVLRRTYNSQDPAAVAQLLPGGIGAGWRLNLGEEAGDFTNVGLAADNLLAGDGTAAAADLTDLALGSVTLVDRDGTRHTFTRKSTSVSPSPTNLLDVASTGFAPKVLGAGIPGGLCVDTSYQAPAGVHLGLYRFVRLGSGTCSSAPGGLVAAGYVAVRPDRVRSEYSATGQILSMTDAAGNELRYEYEVSLPAVTPSLTLGRLVEVYESRGCAYTRTDLALPGTLAAGCRSFHLTYPDDRTVVVTDPALRSTTYALTAPVGTPIGLQYLSSVTDPDGGVVRYGYQGVADGAAAPGCGGTAGQLCSVTDARGGVSRFSYAVIDDGVPTTADPSRITGLTDRRGLNSAFLYETGRTTVTSDKRVQRYGGIDSAGRVGQLVEGDTAGVLYRRTDVTWDTAVGNGTCAQRGVVVGTDTATGKDILRPDNNKCRVLRKQTSPAAGAAADQNTSVVYSEQGLPLITTRVTDADPRGFVTTTGFRTQYVGANSTSVYTDAIDGRGQVISQPRTNAADALYTVTDKTGTLTARGNAADAAGSATENWKAYLTTYTVDANEAKQPGTQPADGVCSRATYDNTGLTCQVIAPASDANGAATFAKTSYTYDAYGQRSTMTTPKANAAGGTPPSYQYAYFADTDRDLTGTVSAGGWLRAVSDPTGKFVAYGYDRAGNTVRTWDRNATAGHDVTDFPGQLAAPPDSRYAEQLYAGTSQVLTGGRDIAPAERDLALQRPWRFVRSSRDALGNRTIVSVDRDGSPLRLTPARGTQKALPGTPPPPTYDVVAEYDAAGLRTSVLLPANAQVNGAASDKPTRTVYDQYGEVASSLDPRGVLTVFDHDNGGRRTTVSYSRGSDVANKPTSCRNSSAPDARFSSTDPRYTTSEPRFSPGVVVCRTDTIYDGLDQVIATSDGDAQVTTSTYDAVGRRTTQNVPRRNNGITTATTSVQYDQDDQPLVVCKPRQAALGVACSATARYATAYTYDAAGRPLSSSVRRDSIARTTSMRYDLDGNQTTTKDANGRSTTAAFDLLDRMTALAKPRAAGVDYSTNYTYDAVGNRLSTTTPVAGTQKRYDAYSYDALNRLVDTVRGASGADAAAAGTSTGGANTRTRLLYDADGHTVGQYTPRAFTSSISKPDVAFLQRSDVDANGRTTAVYSPHAGTGPSDDPTTAAVQPTECATRLIDPTHVRPEVTPAPVDGMPDYDDTVATICVTRTAYDAAGQAVTQTLPTAGGASPGATARQVTMTWTDDGLLASRGAPSPAAAGQIATTSTRYDATGKPIAVTDPLNHVTTYSWTPDDLMSRQSNPGYTRKKADGTNDVNVTHNTVWYYDADGHQTVEVDAKGQTSSKVFTDDDLLYSYKDSGGNLTTYGYDNVGNVTRASSPSSNAADATNPTGADTTYTYTYDNLLLSMTQPPFTGGDKRRVTWSYDEGGRKTQQLYDAVKPDGTLTSPNGGTQKFAYNPNSSLQQTTGRQRTFTNGTTNTTVTGTIKRQYDADGNLTSSADDTNTASGTVTSSYYLDGLTRTVDDGKQTTRYGYDGSGQVLRRQQDKKDATTFKTTSYTYDDAGAPATSQSDNVKASIDPDLTKRQTWLWTQDAAGRTISKTDPNKQYTTFSYQPDDTLLDKTTTRTETGDKSLIAQWRYTYDNLGRQLTSESKQQQTGPGLKNVRKAFGYDPAGRLTSYTDELGPHALTYDADGNRLTYSTEAGTTGTTTRPASTQVSAFNPDDSVKTATDGTPGGAALTSTYSADGTLKNDGCYSYLYDSFDRLKHSEPVGECATAPSNAVSDYDYDGLDRQRTTKQNVKSTTRTFYSDGTHSDASSQQTIDNALNYDGLTGTVVAESQTGKDPASYTLDPGGNSQSLTPQPSSGTPNTNYMLDDGFGTVTTITNDDTSGGVATGFVACATRFDPWGRPRTDSTVGSSSGSDASTTSSTATPSGNAAKTGAGVGLAPSPCAKSTTDGTPTTDVDAFYRGQRRDPGTGTYQLGSRTYDPSKAAFLSQDTYRDAQPAAELAVGTDPLTMNRYAYVNGDPVNYNDPDGHRPACDGNRGCERKYIHSQQAGHQRYTAQAQEQRDSYQAAYEQSKNKNKDQTLHDMGEPAKPVATHSAVYNAFGGFGKGAYALGPGAVGDLAGLVPWSPAQALSDQIDETQHDLQDAYGADADSKAFRYTNVATQVAGTVIPIAGVAGKVGAGAKVAREGAVLAGGERSLGFAAKAGEGLAAEEAGGLASAARTCSVNSFTAATLITMADGSKKPIKDVKVGERVLATDPETGETAARPVTKLIRHGGKHTMVDVGLADGSTISATDHHPFWDATTGEFTYAIDLRPGHQVRQVDGTLLAVAAIRVYDQDLTAYNLTVDGIHTYYAGTTPVLVHNSCGINPEPFERQLENGITRSYGKFRPARTEGPTAGARYVRETGGPGGPRGWMESYYESGSVRQVHPKGGDYPHYLFDELGNFMGSWR
jgi:RHS repeat-associated protein